MMVELRNMLYLNDDLGLQFSFDEEFEYSLVLYLKMIIFSAITRNTIYIITPNTIIQQPNNIPTFCKNLLKSLCCNIIL